MLDLVSTIFCLKMLIVKKSDEDANRPGLMCDNFL